MRRIAVLAFVALAGGAVVVKMLNPHEMLHRQGELARYLPEAERQPARLEPLREDAAMRDAPIAKPAPVVADRELTIVLAGDTGLNSSFAPVYAGFASKHGERVTWEDATAGVAPLLTGDINFANLETVVTDRNDLRASLKLFGFRTHPDAVRLLVRLGLNAFSTANNHSMDYGLEGARETLKHLGSIGVAHAGLGADRSLALKPALVEARGFRVAIGAMGIIGSGYSSPATDEKRVGHLSPQSERDTTEILDSLAAAPADYRLLSVHYGQEFNVLTPESDRARMREALARGADLVAGHHQHVVAGIEIVDGKPIFYGLGNFLHLGTQDMGRHDMCHDYGLVARVHLSAPEGERLRVRAIEAIPVTGMHRATRRMAPEASTARIHALNHLNRQFGARGVRFAAEADGTGLACLAGAERLTGDIGARCRAAPAESEPSPALRAKITDACATRVVRVVEAEEPEAPVLEPAGYTETAGDGAGVLY